MYNLRQLLSLQDYLSAYQTSQWTHTYTKHRSKTQQATETALYIRVVMEALKAGHINNQPLQHNSDHHALHLLNRGYMWNEIIVK